MRGKLCYRSACYVSTASQARSCRNDVCAENGAMQIGPCGRSSTGAGFSSSGRISYGTVGLVIIVGGMYSRITGPANAPARFGWHALRSREANKAALLAVDERDLSATSRIGPLLPAHNVLPLRLGSPPRGQACKAALHRRCRRWQWFPHCRRCRSGCHCLHGAPRRRRTRRRSSAAGRRGLEEAPRGALARRRTGQDRKSEGDDAGQHCASRRGNQAAMAC